MIRLSLSLLVAALFSSASASPPSRVDVLQPRQTTDVAPYSFTADENWDGESGSWSTFSLQIGTPAQTVRTILSWQGYQTWAVIPQGCLTASSYSSCSQSRGGIYNYSASSTFQYKGLYDLYIEQNFGYTGNAVYGFDTVTLGVNGENGLSLKNTTIAGMAYNDFWLGVFGINPKPTNFTSLNDPVPSFMSLLKENKKIPSQSFGFTQGAKYRYSTGVYASLTLGGYDASKYTANNVTFNFNGDNDHQIMVVLQSITVPSAIVSNPSGIQLLPSGPIYIEIDNTVPEIWLPVEACKAFEAEFGLVFDNATELYLITNETLHNQLVALDRNITFTIGQQTSGGQNLNIVLPYAAFDLTASQGYRGLSENTRYFPLRRGQNSTQFLLGRTFMQEAYLIVDYEVSRFQLGQVVWDSSASQQLVAIPPADQAQSSSSWTSSTYQPTYSSGSGSGSGSGSRSLSIGAIVGIVVGAVVILILAAIGLFFFIRKRKQRRAAAAASYPADHKGQEYTKAELMGSTPDTFGMTHHDMDRKGLLLGSRDGYSPTSSGFVHTPVGESTISSAHSNVVFGKTANLGVINEAHSRAIYEMPGDMPNTEKDGRQFSEKEALQHRERIYNGIDEASEGNSSDGMSPTTTGAREGRRVAPENIVNAQTGDPLGRHRAFSFDLDPAHRTNLTDSSGSTLVQHSPSDEAHRPEGNFI